jgi:hypothetical protein
MNSFSQVWAGSSPLLPPMPTLTPPSLRLSTDSSGSDAGTTWVFQRILQPLFFFFFF